MKITNIKKKITKIIKIDNKIFDSNISSYSPFYTSLEILESLCDNDSDKNKLNEILNNIPKPQYYDNISTKLLMVSPYLEEPFKKTTPFPGYIKDYFILMLRNIKIYDENNNIVDHLYDISDKIILLQDNECDKKSIGANSKIVLKSNTLEKIINDNGDKTPDYFKKYMNEFYKYILNKYNITKESFINTYNSSNKQQALNLLNEFTEEKPIFNYRDLLVQIRNCISHVKYKINNSTQTIHFINNENGKINFNIETHLDSLLLLCNEISNFSNFFESVPEIYDHCDYEELSKLEIKSENNLRDYLKKFTLIKYQNLEYNDKENMTTNNTINLYHLNKSEIDNIPNTYNQDLKKKCNLQYNTKNEDNITEDEINEIIIKINKIPNFYSMNTKKQREIIKDIIVINYNKSIPFHIILNMWFENNISPDGIQKILNEDNNEKYYYDTIILFIKTLLNSCFSIYYERYNNKDNNNNYFSQFNLNNIDTTISNKNIFKHIRDSLIHNWIEIKIDTASILDSKITIKDIPDNKENPKKFKYIKTIEFKDILNIIQNQEFINIVFKNELKDNKKLIRRKNKN